VGELYAAHFLGPQGSAKLIEAYQTSPRSSAAAIFPEAAAANRPVFYHEGRPATVAEVYDDLTRAGGAGTVASPPPKDQGFIQYASARRTERVEEERALVDLLLRGPMDAGTDRPSLGGAVFSSEMLRVLSDARDGRRRETG
jgi:hypothetical protein